MTRAVIKQDYSFIVTQQPNDVINCEFDETTYSTLDSMLSLYGDNSNTIPDSGKDSSSCFDDVLDQNTGKKFTEEVIDRCTTPTLALSYQSEEIPLDASELAVRFNEPANEVIITTTPSDSEYIPKDDLEVALDSVEALNLTPDGNEIISKMADILSLTVTDHSIQERTMTVEVQPPENLHPRYASDGKRQIEKSRINPMMMRLPNLREIESDSQQIFLIRLALVTQSDPICIHPNILEYHSTDTIKLEDGTVGVPLTSADIETGTKKFPRLAIVKRTLGTYASTLKPFKLFESNLQSNENEDAHETKRISVKEAKKIVDKYNLTASRISCQLLIKRNETIYGTNITCETHVLEHNSTSKKRPASAMDEGISNKEPSVKSKKKQKKKSNY